MVGKGKIRKGLKKSGHLKINGESSHQRLFYPVHGVGM